MEENFSVKEKTEIVNNTIGLINRISKNTGIPTDKLVGSKVLENFLKAQLDRIRCISDRVDFTECTNLNCCCIAIEEAMKLKDEFEMMPNSCYKQICEQILEHK